MRGLVVDPLGKIVELPVKSNFREGLSVFEYVASGRGSRKGLTDTALKTADAGYLTRRLVDVTHDVLIREEDCGTKEGLTIKKSVRGATFYKRIFGRFELATNTLIDEKRAKELETDEKISEIVVRSPLSCVTRFGICQKCYGWDLSNKQIFEIGGPVGVISAQSIGEPGTQLTLRTKHSGGVIGVDVTQGLPRVEELFETRMPKVLSPISEIAGKVIIKASRDTKFLPEELIDRSVFEEEIEKVLVASGEAATARQTILGITKRALFTTSWLSSASFEQTTDVLAEASLAGRKDRLLGLKENVIIGRLIPIDPVRAALGRKTAA